MRTKIQIVAIMVNELEWKKSGHQPKSGFLFLTYLFYFLCLFQLSTVNCQLSSVLAFEDEIGKRGERTRKFGIGAAIEASFGAAGIVLRECAGAIERAGFVNQRNDCLRADGIEFLFFQHARDQFARIAMAVFHRVDQRQGDLPFFQVAEDRFAELLRGRRKIQQIVDELKRQARVSPVICERLLFFTLETAKHGAKARAVL